MSKHTPGPWIAPKNQVNLVCQKVAYESPEVGALKGAFQVLILGCDGKELRANALMISAAPDMLVALKLTLAKLNRAGIDCALAKAALAKATGEEGV